MAKETRKWLAIYTKPRWEKKVFQLITDAGITCYCPLNKVRRKWSDRIKLVEEPLFTSYVFVFVTNAEVDMVKRVTGVLNFVYWLGKPAVIKQFEIDRIKKFLNEYDDVTTESLGIQANDQVIIRAGALMDKQAKVLRKLGKRVELEIESLGYRLVAYVEMKNLTVIRQKNKA